MKCSMCQDSKVFVWNAALLGEPPETYKILRRSIEYPNLYEIVCPGCTARKALPTQARAA